MSIIYIVLLIIFFLAIILTLATKPSLGNVSVFELQRRSSLGDSQAKNDLLRIKHINAINFVIKLKVLWLQIGVVCFSLLYFGWLIGVFILLAMAVVIMLAADLRFIKKLSRKFYNLAETSLIVFLEKHPAFAQFIGSENLITKTHNIQIRSREELMSLIAESSGALTNDEKRLVANSLTFKERSIASVMTPRNLIQSVDRAEFLGPLVLDELHKNGHSHLPVINGDLDHIIGILNISSLLSLDDKKSMIAEKAMDKKVYFIPESHSLYQALSIFLRTQNRLLVVVNKAKETVGVVILKDVIEALVGRYNNEND